MGQPVIVTGIIISAGPVGDFDKRVVIMTKERGKITAFAKGARRQNSHLIAAMNPFAFGEFELYEGRTSYNVMKTTISNYFLELLEDVERAYYGFYFMELLDYYGQEGNPDVEMLKLIYQSLRALCSDKISNRLIRRIFELKIMMINGEYPELFGCVKCGSENADHGFSSELGGRICNTCKSGVKDYFEYSDSTFYTMQYIVTSKIESLYTFQVSKEVLEELEEIMNRFIKKYIGKKFRSLELIENQSPFIS